MIQQLNRRQFVAGAAALATLAAAPAVASFKPAVADEAQTRTVVDNTGVEREIPVSVQKVADLWHAHNQIVLMLGQGDKLVATTENFSKMPWANVVYPRLAEVPAVVTGNGAGEIAYEELLKCEPDVCFSSSDEKIADLAGYGMVGLNMGYATFDTLRSNVEITAEVLGDGADEIAAQFLAELDENIAYVADTLGDVADEDKVRVLHIVRGTGLTTVDGSNTIIDEWIKLAGGINCMADLGIEGNMQEVTMEEILNADPDVIIVGSTAAQEGIDTIMSSDEWAGIKAVQNGAVYANPMGVFPWDRYSGEEALQILWAAQKLNPEIFADLDMVAKVKDFYAKYYGYELSDDDTQRILNNEEPAAEGEAAAEEPAAEGEAAAEGGALADGTYEASGKGIGGDVPLTVTVEGGVITSVEVGENGETQGIGSKAIEQLPALIVEANGIDGVDGVSGASVTSKAIFSAMEDILTQAAA